MNVWSHLAIDVSSHVFIPEHAARVNVVEHFNIVAKFWVQLLKVGGAKSVCLCPVRLAAVATDDRLVSAEETSVWYFESIRPG